MKNQDLGPVPIPENNPLFEGVEPDLPPRVRFGNFISNARALRHRLAERYATRLFEQYVLGPANLDRESMAQLFKRDELESVTPLEATESFCRMIHAEVGRVGLKTDIKPDLFDNSARSINQIWHARQLADVNRLEYDRFIPQLVALVAGLTAAKGRVEAVDLPRYGNDLADSLNQYA